MAERRLNRAGFSIESIAAQYETDAALAEWLESDDERGEYEFPPPSHYFNSALRAEREEARLDRMEGVSHD